MNDPTTAELLGVVIVLAGIGFSAWALIDDAFDLANVWRFGEVGGPRWITATGHLLTNATMLLAWLCFLVVVAVAVYLPSRTDEPAAELAWWVGWARGGYAALVLFGQVHQRAARIKLRRLPLDAWERMLENMDAPGRATLLSRLERAAGVGRAMGHAVANEMQIPVSMLDELVEDESQPEAVRTRLEAARDALLAAIARVQALHTEARTLDPSL